MKGKASLLTTILVAIAILAAQASARSAVLGIECARFLVNSKPTFLVGISYYGGLGASPKTLKRDLDAMKMHGFNWLRVWATWSYQNDNISAVDAHGAPREPFMGWLKHLVAECDRRGMVVDVTLSRGSAASGSIPDMAAHRAAVESLVKALGARRNWYLDLANERDVRDARYVSTEEIRKLRDLARSLAPRLLVTASFGGHDLNEDYVREALVDARLDFVALHRPREASSPAETEQQTRECLAAMKRIGRIAPVHYQEPFRRGYGDWQPRAQDFAADLKGAVLGGAAGWCFHNGDTRGAEDGRPRRSFDPRDGPLFDQLDSEERRFVEQDLRQVTGRRGSSIAAPSDSGALSVLPSNSSYFRDARGRPVVLVGD
jgi:hypothetical protein